MHILMMTGFGLAALAVFVLLSRMRGASGAEGARLFIWSWFAASLLNGAAGYFRVGIPLLNEVAAFVPIFGIPAAAAYYAAYRLR